jgi:hypothetical protein
MAMVQMLLKFDRVLPSWFGFRGCPAPVVLDAVSVLPATCAGRTISNIILAEPCGLCLDCAAPSMDRNWSIYIRK